MTPTQRTEARLACKNATPGPWKVGGCDDQQNMSAVYVFSGEGPDEVYPDADLVNDRGRSVIAVTLYQYPRIADHESQLWDENAVFIAVAREALPDALDELDKRDEELEKRNKETERAIEKLLSGDTRATLRILRNLVGK